MRRRRQMNAKRRAASLLLGALLAACASNPTSPTPTGSSPPAPSPRPSPSPAGPPSITWTPEAGNGAALRDPAGAGGLGRVTQVGDGLLAVGTDTHGTTIWLRAGAGTWTRLDTDRFALADLVGLASTSLGMVASGTQESGTYGATFPTIWSSADGTAWSTPVLAGDEYRNITPVVELAGRLVALVGGNGAPTDLVSSTDGQAWRRVPALGLPAALLLGLVVAGSRLVAVGQTDMAAAWYSDDGGGSWRAATVPPGGTESTMTSVAAGRDGLIAVGSVAGASDAAIPAVWYSTDGTAWALAARGAGPGGLAAVAHGDDGWVAVGSNDIAGGQDLPDTAQRLGLTAVSGDGRDWVFLAPEKDAEFTSVTATAGGWMAAGRRHASALLWTSGAATARFVGGWPAVTPLACPPVSGRIDLASLLLIPVEQRLACLGPTEVTFQAWVVPQGGRGGTCGGSPTWLTCRLNVPADQVAAHEALTGPTLGVIPRPGAIMPASWNGLLPAGGWLQVTGHFDDPAASTCADVTFGDVDTPARLVSWCRSQFVATRLGSPTPSVTEGGWPVAGATDPVFGRDGTVYAIVRTPDETPQAIVALDAGGHAMPGWPFRLPASVSEVGLAAGRDGSLYATICEPSAAECGLHHFTADGGEPRGWPLPLEGMAECSAPLVGPDGTVYATCAARADGPDPSTGLTVAADPVSGVRTGWPVHYGGDALAIAPDGTLYVNAWQSTWAGDAPMTVATFAPDGTLRSGWPRSWPADAFVRLAPDGTLFAWWYEDRQEGEGGFGAKRTLYEAIGTDGRTLPGWPRSSTGAASSPAFGADGTLYYDAESGDVHARNRKGAVKPGWPVRGVGGSQVAVSPPYVSPDGSILALDAHVVTWLGPGGRALAAWGPGRTGSLSYCTGGATGCAERVSSAPVFAPDRTVYILVWVTDGETWNVDTEIAALDRHGDVKSGWPRSVPGLDFAGPEGAWLRVGPDGRVYVVGSKGLYALLPDGTLAK